VFIVGVTLSLSLGTEESYASLRFCSRDLFGDPTAKTGIDWFRDDSSVVSDGGPTDSMLLLDTSGSCPSPPQVGGRGESDPTNFGASRGMENANESVSRSTGAEHSVGLSVLTVPRCGESRSGFLSVGSTAILPQGPVFRQFRPPRV
jgi:hypothetical protein